MLERAPECCQILHVCVSSRSSMPRPRQPDTLENACISYVAAHESLWDREELTCLPASLTEKLLEEVLGNVALRGGRLWPILLWHFKRSSFFGVHINHVSYKPWTGLVPFHMNSSNIYSMKPVPKINDVEWCFAKFLQSCKQLVNLDLRSDGELYWRSKFDTVGGVFNMLNGCDLSKLQVLNMKAMVFSENTMEMLGNNCPRLRELYLEGCTCVNDDTITLLIKNGHDGQCVLKNLKVIDVRNTNLKQRGVQHILECIPTITHLYHPKVIPVALQLLQWRCLTPPLHLQWLQIDGLCELINSVEHTANVPLEFSAFANVTSVGIFLTNSTEIEQLKVFHQLKNLRKLNIRTWLSESFVFEPCISTLIQNTGSNLHTLLLENVSQISFSTIGKSCPNLRCLTAHFWSVQADVYFAGRQSYFKNVETLCLHQEVPLDGTLPPEIVIHPQIKKIILGLILPMHRLKSLELANIRMDDTFLFSLLSVNPLTLIETIVLSECIYMMNDDILSFIGQCAKLRKLSIGYYNRNDLYAISQLTEEVANRGWDIELSLDSYNLHDFLSDDEGNSEDDGSSNDEGNADDEGTSDDEGNWSVTKLCHILWEIKWVTKKANKKLEKSQQAALIDCSTKWNIQEI